MMYKILTCLERLSIRVPTANWGGVCAHYTATLASIRTGGQLGKEVGEQCLADYRSPDNLWVHAYGDSERRADPMKGSIAQRSSDVDKSKLKEQLSHWLVAWPWINTFLNLSRPLLPYQWNGDKNITYFIGLYWRLNVRKVFCTVLSTQ